MGEQIFFFFKYPDWLWGPFFWTHSLEAEQLGQEGAYAPPTRAKVMNEWSCNSTPVFLQDMHRDNLTTLHCTSFYLVSFLCSLFSKFWGLGPLCLVKDQCDPCTLNNLIQIPICT
jgi:hypothetical protein